MRRLFLALVALLALCLVGCTTVLLTHKEKIAMGEEPKIVDIWQNHNQGSSLASITVVVANPTGEGIGADVSCHFEDDSLFGTTETDVAAYSKRKVMVRGFHQCQPEVCESERIACSMRLR